MLDRTLEPRIVRSYVRALRAPRIINGQNVVSLSRHGKYEVRLIEPTGMPPGDMTPFWIELFDSSKNLSIDSYAGDDLEEAASAAQDLILQAEMLNKSAW